MSDTFAIPAGCVAGRENMFNQVIRATATHPKRVIAVGTATIGPVPSTKAASFETVPFTNTVITTDSYVEGHATITVIPTNPTSAEGV